MRENRTSGSMRRDEKRVMVHSANGHRTRKGGNGGAPPDLHTTALVFHSTERTPHPHPRPLPPEGEGVASVPSPPHPTSPLRGEEKRGGAFGWGRGRGRHGRGRR